MIGRRLPLFAGMLVLAIGLAGCYESPDATFFEAGEYKGANDPLIAQMEDPEFREQLDRRFNRQRDR
ncbi:MAG TPA: hypothetical protein VKO38_06550 [Wenzhouxiangella sp.]|nr:hypothetical protein [Wenzhouxiangella sp.]